ncbi:exonuclease domain-containing protein [Pseudonocardia sp. T1-2H]|uniref:exonuclease domain-containing protein n=1 Tax=Pseudonocardia sp. T1-2H TaxID=3128899 RepID=UPI003100BD73
MTILPSSRTPLVGMPDPGHLGESGLSFVAIDVETANSHRGSICALGVVVVRAGVVVSTHSWLSRPPEGLDFFHGFNTMIHGITAEMVADQPTFSERLDQLLELASGLPLVAHNAAFDLGVLREACVAVERDWPSTEYACSLVMARRALDLISYRLPVVAAEFGIKLGHHHEAGADALACARVVLEIARRRNIDTWATYSPS